jgi:hypothetical protein
MLALLIEKRIRLFLTKNRRAYTESIFKVVNRNGPAQKSYTQKKKFNAAYKYWETHFDE